MAKLNSSPSKPGKSTRKKRTFNPRVFRSKRAYSFADIAEMLDTHIRTVQIWRKEGLKILDDSVKPFMAMGQDIQDFLSDRVAKRKKPLQPGEFFCTRCQSPRRSRAEHLRIELTNRMLGANHRQAIMRGNCEVCGSRLCLFSSEQKLGEWPKPALMPTERRLALGSNGESSSNTDISRVDQYDQSKRQK